MTSVVYEQLGRIVLLTLNRPDSRNALSEDLVEELVAGLLHADADPMISCIILRGAGKGFSSGGNLSELRELTASRRPTPAELIDWYASGIQRIPKTFYELNVPTIAAVHGHAIGAGCDLAAMCDLRIAADTASFAESFARVGLISGDGGAWYLPRAVGMARAKEMALTCRAVDAKQALEWGLVSSVTTEANLLEAALDLASDIANLPPAAMRKTKELMRRAEGMTLAEVLQISAEFQADLHLHPEHLPAIDALLGKKVK